MYPAPRGFCWLFSAREKPRSNSCSPLRSSLTALSCGEKSRKTSGTRVLEMLREWWVPRAKLLKNVICRGRPTKEPLCNDFPRDSGPPQCSRGADLFFSPIFCRSCDGLSWKRGTARSIYNSKGTEWSIIRSEIIRVINSIGRPRSWSPIC